MLPACAEGPQIYEKTPDYPNFLRSSSIVISAITALPDGEKLQSPHAPS